MLQEDLLSVYSWCVSNGLSFNITKSFYNIFTRGSDFNLELVVNGQHLSKIVFVKDLGVIFDPRLDFKEHLSFAVSKALRKLFFVLRQSRVFKRPGTIVHLFKSLVVPSLLYASVVWRPFFVIDSAKVERIQHVFSRSLAAKCNNPMSPIDHDYSPLMLEHGLLSMDELATYSDLVFFHKVVNGIADVPGLLELVNLRVPARLTRNISDRFYLSSEYRNFYRRSVICRLSMLGNRLPTEVDIFNLSVFKFKSLLLGGVLKEMI